MRYFMGLGATVMVHVLVRPSSAIKPYTYTYVKLTTYATQTLASLGKYGMYMSIKKFCGRIYTMGVYRISTTLSTTDKGDTY